MQNPLRYYAAKVCMRGHDGAEPTGTAKNFIVLNAVAAIVKSSPISSLQSRCFFCVASFALQKCNSIILKLSGLRLAMA